MQEGQGREEVSEEILLNEDPDISTADAVSLFNTSLASALKLQKAEILEELRNAKIADPIPESSNVSANNLSNTAKSINTNICQPAAFEFKQEGTKIQFNFNTERISALKTIETLV